MSGLRIAGVFWILFLVLPAAAEDQTKGKVAEVAISAESQACIACHTIYTPNIVKDWQASRHSRITPAMAQKLPDLERRVSSASIPERYMSLAVGCFECHSQNRDRHKDNFKHNGYQINVLVTPNDCKTCHEKEAQQFANTKKANAYKNLMNNPVYNSLVHASTGMKKIENGRIAGLKASDPTLNDGCLGCHGTRVEMKGMKEIRTRLGQMSVPNLSNWPNNGVGRENPDGSIGFCASCHPRHSFSIEVSRKPYTCAQCHLEPDVPAYNVYKESKHGNVFESLYHQFDFTAVPWRVGRDFRSPTCATCHNSLITTPDGKIIAERSHDFGARLWVRIFGLPYSHPQPKSGDTTIIKNKDGLPLPTTLARDPAAEYLMSDEEQNRRQAKMQAVCTGCHASPLVEAHFEKFEVSNRESDAMVLAATQLMNEAWEKKLEDRANLFDESIERLWTRQWLFYANTVRYASAMTAAPDYGAFKYGWWDLTETLAKMRDLMDLKGANRKTEEAPLHR